MAISHFLVEDLKGSTGAIVIGGSKEFGLGDKADFFQADFVSPMDKV